MWRVPDLRDSDLEMQKVFFLLFDLRQLIAKYNNTKELEGDIGGRCYGFIYKTKSNEMRDLQHARFMS